MKKKCFVLFTAVMVVLLFAGQADAGRYMILNHTGVDLYELRVSPHRHNLWSADLLQGRILRNHQSCSVVWDTSARNMWDMEGKDARGNAFLWTGFDIRNTVKIIVDPLHARCIAP